MFNKEKDYIGINLSEESVKVIHFKISPSEKKVVGVTKRDVRQVPETELPGIIRSAMEELKIKKASAFCTIPASLVTTKNIEIPSLDQEEIKSIIDLQAGRHTPFSREEILIGHINIGVFQRNYTKILLVIINRETIKQQMQIFESAGVMVDKVLFVPEGIAHFYAKVLDVKQEDVPVGIIDIAYDISSFAIEFNKTVATCRSIPVGMSHLIKEGKEAQEKLADELARSVEAYQAEDISKLPETYILTSDDEKIKELHPLLQDKLKANVKVMPYLDHIKADQSIMLKLVSEYNDDSFFSIIAAASSIDEIRVDLTPDEIKTQRVIEEKGKDMFKCAILGIIIFALIVAIFFSKVYFRGIYLEKLRKEYAKKRSQVIALDRIAQKTQIIKEFVNSRMVSLDVVDELYRLMPDEIYLQSVFLDEGGLINIQGISESMSIVFNFVSAIDKSELFKNVNPKSTTDTKDRGKDVASFVIEFRLEGTKEVVKKEAEVEEELAEE